jgi:hypothetical protein
MSQRIVVTGTDTGIGKTVFAAGLADLLGADYWKPIQAGLEGETDSRIVARLGGLSGDRIVPEAYRLQTPASPHYAAAIDGVGIAVDALDVPDTVERPLVIEGSGGLLVPLNRGTLLYRRLCEVAHPGRALRGHCARHHQSFAAVDRSAAKSQARTSRHRFYRREQSGKRARHWRDGRGPAAWATAPAFAVEQEHASRGIRGFVQSR